jgi:hypothetical protein
MYGASALMNYDPSQWNQQFQGTGAMGPQFDQNAYNQTFGNYQSAIQPMLGSIADMNARMLNERELPGVAAGAIGSGNTAGSKWGNNSAIAERGAMDRNAQAAAQMYAQGAQQGNQIGGAYGQSMADAMNRAMLQNSALGNQYNFGQADANRQAQLRALGLGTDAFSKMVDQTNPYWQGMLEAQTQLPGMYANMGMMQRNAPADWLNMQQDALLKVGNAGTGGAAGAGGTPGGNIMQGAGAGWNAGLNFGQLFGGNSLNPQQSAGYGNKTDLINSWAWD